MQLATVVSGVQVPPPVVQQYSVEPAFPGMPAPQLSAESLSGGVSEPVHEYPWEPPAQFATVVSGAQLVPVPTIQQ
jgi:hypothetical protein